MEETLDFFIGKWNFWTASAPVPAAQIVIHCTRTVLYFDLFILSYINVYVLMSLLSKHAMLTALNFTIDNKPDFMVLPETQTK